MLLLMLISTMTVEGTQHLCGVANDDCVCRDVVRHGAPGADQRAFTDRDVCEDGGSRSDGGASHHACGFDRPVLLRLQFAVGRGCSRERVVDEHDAMADEDVVFDGHPLADECVAGDLASPADPRVLLYFDECADLRLVADLEAVEVDELRKTDAVSKLDVRRDADE